MLSGPSYAPSEQQDLALEGRSISLQHRAVVTTTSSSVLVSAATPQQQQQQQQQHLGGARSFQPLQLRIDLQGEQQEGQQEGQQPTRKESRRQRLQARRREQQQRPAQEVVYQRRGTGASSAAPAPGVSVLSRPKTAARLPLPISTTSMPAHNQKFSLAGDTTTAVLLGSSAQEASAVVKRLLAEEHHHHVSSSTMVTSSSSSTSMRSSSTRQQQDQQGYLQDSFNFLHQRHIKNLTDVISQHQKQQQQREQQQQEQVETAAELAHTVKHKKQVHIHQSSFYEQGSQNGHHNPIIEDLNGDTSTSGSNNSFKSTKTINLSNGGGMEGGGGNLNRSSTSDSSSSSTSSISTTSSATRYRNTTSSSDECCSDNFNNNNNNLKNNKMNNSLRTNTELRKQSSTTSTSSSNSSSSRAGQHQAKQKLELENGGLLQDDGRIAIDVTVTPGGRQGFTSSSSKSVRSNTVVSKSVSDGRTVRTDVEKLSEEAEERSEGPVITFSHVSSEGCQESFQHRLDEDVGKLLEDGSSSSDVEAAVMGMKMSSPLSRSRSASPLLEVPAPAYSREIRRPPMEKA